MTTPAAEVGGEPLQGCAPKCGGQKPDWKIYKVHFQRMKPEVGDWLVVGSLGEGWSGVTTAVF